MQSDTSNIKISVILPNYNGEGTIEKAINSFINQNYENKELIIVDGKSKDRSHEIIQAYVTDYNNIKWIQEKDINATDAINIGIKYVSGDFISFLASDVFYFDNDIFETINSKYSQINFDAVYFDHYRYYPNKKQISLIKCPNIPFTKNNLLMYGTIVGFDNIFLSHKVYQKHLLDPNYNLCSDWEFFLRITQDELLFLYIEKVCAVDVQDGNNLSLKFQAKQTEEVNEVSKLYNSDNVKLFFDQPLPAKFFEPTLSYKIKSWIKNTISKYFGI